MLITTTYQQITTQNYALFSNPLKKTQQTLKIHPAHHTKFFCKNTYFRLTTFVTIAFGDPPAGKIVNSAGPSLPCVRITVTSPE
jgi:hypothetical protein